MNEYRNLCVLHSHYGRHSNPCMSVYITCNRNISNSIRISGNGPNKAMTGVTKYTSTQTNASHAVTCQIKCCDASALLCPFQVTANSPKMPAILFCQEPHNSLRFVEGPPPTPIRPIFWVTPKKTYLKWEIPQEVASKLCDA